MKQDILSEINILREKLNNLVSISDINLSDEKILTISVQLDKLINNYIKISSDVKKLF